MIQTLSEDVIIPLAGLVITYVLCGELISMVTEKNNMHDVDTFMFFQTAVLPLDKELYAELLKAEDMRRCTVCDAAFASSSNHAKYCPDCRKRITRKQAAERMRKRRVLITR